jgi:hypothetical protein
MSGACGLLQRDMEKAVFRASLSCAEPPPGLSIPLQALWWDAKGDWALAHSLIDSLDSLDGMAVHAYLHRKEGEEWNADYWYSRSGKQFSRPELSDEWEALLEALLSASP